MALKLRCTTCGETQAAEQAAHLSRVEARHGMKLIAWCPRCRWDRVQTAEVVSEDTSPDENARRLAAQLAGIRKEEAFRALEAALGKLATAQEGGARIGNALFAEWDEACREFRDAAGEWERVSSTL